jgi:hypothetical protein
MPARRAPTPEHRAWAFLRQGSPQGRRRPAIANRDCASRKSSSSPLEDWLNREWEALESRENMVRHTATEQAQRPEMLQHRESPSRSRWTAC